MEQQSDEYNQHNQHNQIGQAEQEEQREQPLSFLIGAHGHVLSDAELLERAAAVDMRKLFKIAPPKDADSEDEGELIVNPAALARLQREQIKAERGKQYKGRW